MPMPDAGAMEKTDLGILGFTHVVIEASDPLKTAVFYNDVLGLESRPGVSWPQCGQAVTVTLTLGAGQNLILAAGSNLTDLRETGVHQALRADADPPDQHSGDEHLGEPGAQHGDGAVRRRVGALAAVALLGRADRGCDVGRWRVALAGRRRGVLTRLSFPAANP